MKAVLEVACPRCRAVDDFTEWASRPTTQPVELLVGDAGRLEFGEWGAFDYSDGTENETIVCRSCEYQWADIGHLELHMRAVQALDLLRLARAGFAEDDITAHDDLGKAIALLEPIDLREPLDVRL